MTILVFYLLVLFDGLGWQFKKKIYESLFFSERGWRYNRFCHKCCVLVSVKWRSTIDLCANYTCCRLFPAILFLIRYVASFTESIASPSIENQSPAKEKKTVFNGILKNVEVTASHRKKAMSVECEKRFYRGRAFFSFPCYLMLEMLEKKVSWAAAGRHWAQCG